MEYFRLPVIVTTMCGKRNFLLKSRLDVSFFTLGHSDDLSKVRMGGLMLQMVP